MLTRSRVYTHGAALISSPLETGKVKGRFSASRSSTVVRCSINCLCLLSLAILMPHLANHLHVRLCVHAPLNFKFLFYICIHVELIKRCTCILNGNIYRHEIYVYVWCTYLRILLNLFQGMARSAFMANTSAAGAS